MIRRSAAAFLLLLVIQIPITTAARPDWQQRVNYDISVTLVDSLRTWVGIARITYINNSPDTLRVLWFRLPAEAKRGGSVVDRTQYRGTKHRMERVPESEWGGMEVDSVGSETRRVAFIPDGSIARLTLDPPIVPGDSASFFIAFRTKFPGSAAAYRIQYNQGQYKGAYWYPMICPYTPQYGWTVNRYFGTAEAYGEFGDFNVRYTVPYRFIVASTGLLVNEDEVLPPERLAGLAKDNPDPLPIPEGPEGERPVTWVYRAENVPDVAFAADPNFLIDREDFGDFEAWAFIRRGRQEQWSDAAHVIGWTISQLESIYGPYPWPRVCATDSWSAMEFPMLTMMSWKTPLYRYVMIHEVVHNYTPMIIHSNSVDASFLDEGFTTFIEHILAARYDSTAYTRFRGYTRGLFSRDFMERDDISRGRRPYLESVLEGRDLPMVRAADVAEDYPQLRVSTYYKTPVMLNALRSVIGEENFWRGLRVYYRDHALTHVDEQDMIESFEKASGQPLGWFFKQFLYSSGDIDYRLSGLKQRKTAGGSVVSFNVERRGEVRLPVRLGIILAGGDTLRGEVSFLPTDPPLDNYQRWGWWNQLHDPAELTTVEVTLPAGERAKALLLDPENRYTDRNPTDNRLPREWPKFRFDPGFLPISQPPIDREQLLFGPLFGYSERGGVIAGLKFRKDFMGRGVRTRGDLLDPVQDQTHAPYWRFSTAVPLGGDCVPPEAVARFGRMHDDRWAILGVHRAWRPRSHYYRDYDVLAQAGIWTRRGDAPAYLTAGNDYDVETARFFRLTLSLSKPLGGFQYREKLDLLSGSYGDKFAVLEWSGTLRRSFSFGWSGGLEARLAYVSDKTPPRFRLSPSSGSALALLGDPLFGSSWGGGANSQAFPLPYTEGALVNRYDGVRIQKFAASRVNLQHPLPGMLRRTGWKQLDRFLGRTRFGGFLASGLLYSNDRMFDGKHTGYLLEAGPELGLDNLYGLTVSLRWAPWRASGGEGEKPDFYGPAGWRWKDWGRNALIVVKLYPDVLLR